MNLFLRMPSVVAWICLVAITGSLIGCSKAEKAEVTGTITLNGKAPDLDGLQINFISEAGGEPVSGVINKDGTFKVEGVPLGKVLGSVTLLATGDDAQAKQKEAGMARLKKKEAREKAKKGEGGVDAKALRPQAGGKETNNPIPPEMLDPRTSGISLTVEADKQNTLTFDIKTE